LRITSVGIINANIDGQTPKERAPRASSRCHLCYETSSKSIRSSVKDTTHSGSARGTKQLHEQWWGTWSSSGWLQIWTQTRWTSKLINAVVWKSATVDIKRASACIFGSASWGAAASSSSAWSTAGSIAGFDAITTSSSGIGRPSPSPCVEWTAPCATCSWPIATTPYRRSTGSTRWCACKSSIFPTGWRRAWVSTTRSWFVGSRIRRNNGTKSHRVVIGDRQSCSRRRQQ